MKAFVEAIALIFILGVLGAQCCAITSCPTFKICPQSCPYKYQLKALINSGATPLNQGALHFTFFDGKEREFFSYLLDKA